MIFEVNEEDLIKCNKYYEYLHKNPELSGEEFETSIYIQNKFENLGYEIIKVSKTGFIAFLNLNFKETISLRAELDALPILEDEKHIIKSCNRGISHACGHDGHMAMMLTVGEILSRNKEKLNINVAILFEEGEETGIGNPPFITALKKFNIRSIWGIHFEPDLPSGFISISEGPIMAGDTDIEIIIRGKGGHSSRPDYCNNPINVVAAIIQSIRLFWADVIDPESKSTFSFTKVNAGDGLNIIPDTAYIGANLRFFDKKIAKFIISSIKKRVKLIAEEYGCEVEFSKSMDIYGNITINDIDLTRKIKNTMKENNLEENIRYLKPLYSSESFANFCEKYKCVYSFLGNQPENKNTPLHSSKFIIDINQFELGIKSSLCYVETENYRGDTL